LKPIQKEELNGALDKLKRIRLNTVQKIENLIQTANKTTVKEYKKRFLVSAGTKLKSIEIIDISYFYYVDRISFLVTTDGQKFPISFSLDKLESMLNPEDFFRVNRQFMVKHPSIRQIQLYPKGRIKIDLTPECREEVLISIDRITAFKDWLGK
jgi:DNA-binding LytR/AlgR family response regulator